MVRAARSWPVSQTCREKRKRVSPRIVATHAQRILIIPLALLTLWFSQSLSRLPITFGSPPPLARRWGSAWDFVCPTIFPM